MDTEANKREILLSTNAFNKPAELSGINAWSQLILNLMYTIPGSYPSMPEMGIGIQLYEYEFVDDILDEIATNIKSQVAIYLKEVPLVDVKATKVISNGDEPSPVLLIILSFENNNNIESTAIAASIKGNKILDFDITWK